jgi:hypothetical protein
LLERSYGRDRVLSENLFRFFGIVL